MKNLDKIITPPCEPAVAAANADACQGFSDPRCQDPAFALANPGLCGVDPRCIDPAFSEAHPEVCGPSTNRIILKPSSLLMCEGKSVQLHTYIMLGTVETEITTGLIYQSSNQDVALIGAIGGNVTGIAPGTADISVEWMGKRAYATVQVLAGADCCEDIENRIVLLIDNSKSMGVEFGGAYATKLSFAKAAALKFINGVDLAKDKIALVTFNEAGQQVLAFSSDAAVLTNAVNAIATTQSKTNVWDGLDEAIAVSNAGAISGSRKAIVIFSDFANKLGADPVPQAQQYFGSGGIIIVVGVRANGSGYVLGNQLASGGFFINAYGSNADLALSSLDGVGSYFCSGDCIPKGDLYASRAALNYAGFTNWNITSGHMDLIGTGSDGVSIYDLIPGNGLYVDRAGSSAVFASTIETKQAFAFTPGNQYRLTLRYAGNQRSATATGKELLTLGAVTAEITREWDQNFTDEIIEFTVAADINAKLILQYIADVDGAYGYLLDIVKLENLTTGGLMFLETWDNENLTYIPPGCGQGTVLSPEGYTGYGYYCGNDCINIPPATQTPDPIISVDVEEPAPPPVYSSTKTCTKACPSGTAGSDVSRTSTQTSLVSQADADVKALAAACAAAEAALVCTYGFAVDTLLNFNCKSSAAEASKAGVAAAGGEPTDFWTVIGGEAPTINVRAKNVSGQQTDIYATVVDSLVSRSNPTHPDAMMQSGIGAITGSGGSPNDPVPTRIAITGLEVGEYDFYLYGHQSADNANSVFTLKVGTFTAQSVPIAVTTYGPAGTVNGPGANNATWGYGAQYVRIRCVVATAGHVALITAGLGADGSSRVNGFQIRRLGSGPSTTGLITINDLTAATPYPSIKYVTGLTGVISNVRLNIFGFFHRSPDDVDILLVAPDGTHVVVQGDCGGAVPGIVTPGRDYSIDDGGAFPALPDATPMVNATVYSSANYLTASDPFAAPAPPYPHSTTLAALVGKQPNGAWKLYVVDDAGTDNGQITNWTLTITTTVLPAPSGADLEVTFSQVGSPDPIAHYEGPGTPIPIISWKIKVKNNGPDTADNVVLALSLNRSRFWSYSGPGTFSATPPSLSEASVTLGNIASGAEVEGTVTAIASTSASVTQTLTATVSLVNTDPIPGNNSVSDTVTVA